ncbi:MAG: type II toxin-antitoxin system Phd/YefM family antitoxin [Spirochaetales bacterium]|nr:type II toxin-antitoxin system Phd/YefM family antitoxin [Spirochaetales bacterium]
MKSVTTHEAKTHLSALLKAVERGEEVTIRRGQNAIAKLIRIDEVTTPKRPPTGTVTSKGVRYDPEAFEPLDREGMERLGLV